MGRTKIVRCARCGREVRCPWPDRDIHFCGRCWSGHDRAVRKMIQQKLKTPTPLFPVENKDNSGLLFVSEAL